MILDPKNLKPEDRIDICIEIIKCSNLLHSDDNHLLNPWVKVKMGNIDLHQTKPISQTINPVWSRKTDSTFCVESTFEQLRDNGGLRFKVKDGSTDLGEVKLEAESILIMKPEPTEFKIKASKGTKNKDGLLKIKCRKATKEDLCQYPSKKSLNFSFKHLPKSLKNKYYDSSSSIFNVTSTSDDVSVLSTTSQNTANTNLPTIVEPVDSSLLFRKKKTSNITNAGDKNNEPVNSNPTHYVEFHIEIKSCRNLLIADKTSSDPYVKVKLGKSDIHETKCIKKTLNPIFGSEHCNTFCIKNTVKEVEDAGGVQFKIKDYDRFGANDDLGEVLVPLEALYEMKGEAVEFNIAPPKERGNEEAGFLTISCRSAIEKKNPCSAIEKKKPCSDDLGEVMVPSAANLKMTGEPVECIHDQADVLEIRFTVISCRDLLIADKTSSDPYVKVKLGKSDIHETKCIKQTLNPIFGSEHCNTFCIENTVKEVGDAGGVQFKIKDYDRFGANDDLGEVLVPLETLYEMKGEAVEFNIAPPKERENEEAGFLTISWITATIVNNVDNFTNAGGNPTDYMDLCIEIKSCRNLLIADKTSSDPFVKVKLGKSDIHETKCIKKTLNPIFGSEHCNTFCIKYTVGDAGGVQFKIKDYDLMGANDDLGEVLVPLEALYEMKGEAVEFNIAPPKERGNEEAGFLTISCRPATEKDTKKPEKKSALQRLRTGNKVEKGTEKGTEKETVIPFVVEEVPRSLLVDNSSICLKYIMRPNDNDHAKELLDLAMKENITTKWVDFYNLKLSETKNDIDLAKSIETKSSITKICLYDLEVLCDIHTTPPFLSAISKLPNLDQLEIRMKDCHELPYPFLLSLLELSPVKNLILWKVLFDASQLKLVYAAMVGNCKIERFELWESGMSGNDETLNDETFAELTGTMLRFDTTLKKMVISNIGLSGKHCSILADALQSNCTLKELVLLNIQDAPNAMDGILRLVNEKIESLRITFGTNDSGNHHFYETLESNSVSRRRKALAASESSTMTSLFNMVSSRLSLPFGAGEST